MIESEPRKWVWTYHPYPTPVHYRGEAIVGGWRHNDDRDLRDYIGITVTAEGRFRPHVGYWDGTSIGLSSGSPSSFPRTGTLEDAIALCERYLARDPLEW
jgi:hypothetical protein